MRLAMYMGACCATKGYLLLVQQLYNKASQTSYHRTVTLVCHLLMTVASVVLVRGGAASFRRRWQSQDKVSSGAADEKMSWLSSSLPHAKLTKSVRHSFQMYCRALRQGKWVCHHLKDIQATWARHSGCGAIQYELASAAHATPCIRWAMDMLLFMARSGDLVPLRSSTNQLC